MTQCQMHTLLLACPGARPDMEAQKQLECVIMGVWFSLEPTNR